MAAIVLHNADALQLSNSVNAVRLSGYIPSGGLTYINGAYVQLLIPGTSAQNYTIVTEFTDTAFAARAGVLSGLGAFALGAIMYVNGMYVQAFGDMAGGGGGTPITLPLPVDQGGTGQTTAHDALVALGIPDGTATDQVLTWDGTQWIAAAGGGGGIAPGTIVGQTTQWDGSAWQPGITPADAKYFHLNSALGAPLPAIDSSKAAGSVAGYVVVDVTGQGMGGLYMLDGSTTLLQINGGGGSWGLNGGGTATIIGSSNEASIQFSPCAIRAQAARAIIQGPGATTVYLETKVMFPLTTSDTDLGKTGNRWNNIYLQNAPNVVSDSTYKTEPQAIPDAVLDAVGDVDIVQFKLLTAVAKGEENARLHVGVIAQQLVDAFASHGLDATEYGVVLYDSWDDEPAVLDDDGNVVTPEVVAGGMWSIRYEELLTLEAARVRRELAKLVS